MAEKCPHCGAELEKGTICEEHFYQILFWEGESQAVAAVHHYTVLCYHLQHPGKYSAEGLQDAIWLLGEFINGKSPAQIRRERKHEVSSSNRTWKITGSGADYDPPVRWTMTIDDVISSGLEGCAKQVEAWAHSMYKSLNAAGYYASKK